MQLDASLWFHVVLGAIWCHLGLAPNFSGGPLGMLYIGMTPDRCEVDHLPEV